MRECHYFKLTHWYNTHRLCFRWDYEKEPKAYPRDCSLITCKVCYFQELDWSIPNLKFISFLLGFEINIDYLGVNKKSYLVLIFSLVWLRTSHFAHLSRRLCLLKRQNSQTEVFSFFSVKMQTQQSMGLPKPFPKPTKTNPPCQT